MEYNNILSIVGIVISILGSIFVICNHKRIRMKCGKSEINASIDVEDTTPPTEKLKIKIPPKKEVVEEVVDDSKFG